MKILFAGIIARYPFGGVTWCSLMYLLGLRALGHEVFYIEDTGECVYDPVQNTRATDPTYGTTYIHNALEPYGLGDRWSFVNYDGSYHGRSADDVRRYCGRTPICSSTCRADRGSGATSTRASRTRCSSIPIRRSRSSRSPRPSRGTSSSSSASIICSPSARTSARRRRRFRPARSRGTRPGSRSRWTTGATDAAPRDRFTTRDDVADRELHRRRRQQGSGVREVHRPAVADAAALRARDQRAAAAAARARLGHGRRDGACRARRRTTATSSSGSKAEFGVAKHTYVANRSGWFSDRTECYLASGRPALVQDTGWTAHLPSGDGLLAFSTPDEALAGIDRINGDYDRHARRARRDRARALRRARRAAARCSDDGVRHEDRAHRAGRDDDSAAQVRLGRDDDVAAHRRARRARPRRHAVRDRRLEDQRRRCTRSTRTATGTTSTCGRGSSTRC